MKNIYIIIGIIVLAALGYWGYTQYMPKTAETPDNGSQGKLNINVICDEALAYMSFPDGASADVFLTDCKEGKHPEVIEQYKENHNLGDGALY